MRSADPSAIRAVDPAQWRSELLAQAAASAVGQGITSFPEVMLGLLRSWPDSADLDLESGGRVGPATRRCPPAEALLLRAAHACLQALE